MDFQGTTYRPPMEYNSMLLQVTVGCAHNKCRFCSMYKDVGFSVSSMDQIEKDLKEARTIYKNAERIFLVNGDAFVLPASRLKLIAEKIMEYFPECRVISMYSSISNIRSKTDKELNELKSLRINDLYIGVESGSDEVLYYMKKGHSVEEAKKEIKRLDNAGINHNALFILGAGGRGRGLENAGLTAKFINETSPGLIWVGTLGVFESSELFEDVKNGSFELASEIEILREEIELIKNIDLDNLPFYGNHPTNLVAAYGVLQKDKDAVLQRIENTISEYGEKALDCVFDRNSL